MLSSGTAIKWPSNNIENWHFLAANPGANMAVRRRPVALIVHPREVEVLTMVRLTTTLMSALTVALVAGCAAHPEPIVDLKGLDPQVFQADLEECRVYADQVDAGEAVVKGAAVGAVIGVAVGAISGNAGRGAGYGGIAGAMESGQNAEYEKRVVFARCLEGRGYRVLNSPSATPPYRGHAPGYPTRTSLPEVWTPTITSEL